MIRSLAKMPFAVLRLLWRVATWPFLALEHALARLFRGYPSPDQAAAKQQWEHDLYDAQLRSHSANPDPPSHMRP